MIIEKKNLNDILDSLLENKVIKLKNKDKKQTINLLSKKSIRHNYITELKECFEKYFQSISFDDMNNGNMEKQITIVDNILSYANYMYEIGMEIMSDSLYDNQNGQRSIINNINDKSPDKSYLSVYFQLILSLDEELFNKIAEVIKNPTEYKQGSYKFEELFSNFNDLEKRILFISTNPTSSFEVINTIQNNSKKKELPESVLTWANERKLNIEHLTNLLNTFQNKVPVVGEEGSTITKSTDMEMIQDTIEENGESYYTPKLDGLSGYGHYIKKTDNTFALSGFYGRGGKSTLTNIDYKSSMIKSLPNTLNNELNHIDKDINEVEIRGEIIIKKLGTSKETLELINQDLKKFGIDTKYTNLRNAAAGMIKSEDLHPYILEKYLDFIPFHLYQIDNEKDATKINSEKSEEVFKDNSMLVIPNIKANTKTGLAIYNLMDCISNDLDYKHLKSEIGTSNYSDLTEYPYECDGVILTSKESKGKVNDNNELIGVSALKFSAPTANTIIKDIKTRMNKSNISFVIEIEPTYIGGVIVKNVSGAVKETKNIETFLNIYQPGQEIEIARSGGVIPNLLTPIDSKSNETFNFVNKSSKSIFEDLFKEKLITQVELENFSTILEYTFNSNYNSTSKTHWMNIKIGSIFNNLINSKKPLQKALEETISYIIKTEINDNPRKKELQSFLVNYFKKLDINEDYSKEITNKNTGPKNCPSCNELLELSDTGKQLSCINDSCVTRRVSKLTTYLLDLQKNGNKTNVDDRTMEVLLSFLQKYYYEDGDEQNSINDYIKLYSLMDDKQGVRKLLEYTEETKDFDNPLAFKEKRAVKFIESISLTKNTSETVFFGSLNIEDFGKSLSKKLFNEIDLLDLLNYDYSNPELIKELQTKIISIDEFADKTAITLINFLKKNQRELLKLYYLVEPTKHVKIEKRKDLKQINVTGTGTINWDFFKEHLPEGNALSKAKLGTKYTDIPSLTDKGKVNAGGKEEIKEILKSETMVLTFNKEEIQFVGGGNPSKTKTDLVISDDIKAALSKSSKFTNKIILDDLTNPNTIKQLTTLIDNNFIDDNNNKIFVVTTTEVFKVIFKKELNNNNVYNHKIYKT